MDPKIIAVWRAKLTDLLARARDIAQTGSLDERLALADELQDFIIDNPSAVPEQPETAEFDEMDKIARKAHDGLLLDAINDRLATIMGQTAELAGLTKKIQGQTTANAQAAKSILLEKARQVVAATNDAVTAIKALKIQVESQTIAGGGDLGALGDALNKALQSLQELRTEVESTG